MSGRLIVNRRRFITLAGAGAGGLVLAGCDRWSSDESARNFLDKTDTLTEAVQRLVVRDGTLAREFTEADISANFRANGSIEVADPEYNRIAGGGFADYRLKVSGMVAEPLSLSLDEIRALPARTQITRHDCVEGWSSIGKWTGPQLKSALDLAGVLPNARYAVFHCWDKLNQPGIGRVPYYESIGMEDALHPQTILAYEMNDDLVPIRHGAPIRLRVERQLGYKHPKFVREIEIVESFSGIRGGKGGYYEDGAGYEWYAGI